MEAVGYSEISVNLCKTTYSHIPEVGNIHNHRHDSHRLHIMCKGISLSLVSSCPVCIILKLNLSTMKISDGRKRHIAGGGTCDSLVYI
jgi:hypothetical protein